MRVPIASSILALFVTGALILPGSAAPAHRHKSGVHFSQKTVRGGTQALVSEGPGTGYGFHRLPGPYRVGARLARERQADAVHDAVETDALTTGPYRSGFYGDDTEGSRPYSAYGVFNGADGYGSPFFAGYYGPGDGEDLGPLGRTYNDD